MEAERVALNVAARILAPNILASAPYLTKDLTPADGAWCEVPPNSRSLWTGYIIAWLPSDADGDLSRKAPLACVCCFGAGSKLLFLPLSECPESWVEQRVEEAGRLAHEARDLLQLLAEQFKEPIGSLAEAVRSQHLRAARTAASRLAKAALQHKWRGPSAAEILAGARRWRARHEAAHVLVALAFEPQAIDSAVVHLSDVTPRVHDAEVTFADTAFQHRDAFWLPCVQLAGMAQEAIDGEVWSPGCVGDLEEASALARAEGRCPQGRLSAEAADVTEQWLRTCLDWSTAFLRKRQDQVSAVEQRLMEQVGVRVTGTELISLVRNAGGDIGIGVDLIPDLRRTRPGTRPLRVRMVRSQGSRKRRGP